jgi:gallate dioxygenase
VVNVLQHPLPKPMRCYRLGQAIGRAIRSYSEDLKVAMVGTGGLSHQMIGERAGFNDEAWDREFLDLIDRDPERLARMSVDEFARRGGNEGAEVIMWLVMRGALSKRVRKLHQTYYLPSMAPIASVIYEDASDEHDAESVAQYRERIARQWSGIEKLPGTYPFTLDRSVKCYRLNAFLHRLIEPEFRQRFLADPEPLFAADERDMIRRRDWRAMIQYGAIFFVLEKLAAVIGLTNLHVYAAMRGQSLEEFQKTRNAQVLYSVADPNRPPADSAAT